MRKTQKNIFYFSLLVLQFFLFACKKDSDDDIDPGTPDAFVTAFVDDINADSIKANVQWMQNYTSRFFLKDNRKQIASDIKSRFLQLGYPDTRIDSFYLVADWNSTTYYTWQYNVIARLQGNATPNNIYVIGAHYDCMVDDGDPFVFAPGANDNASGIAGIIEIARVLKKHTFQPKSTIEFVAFASEENNLDGSADYAYKARDNNANIIMMLNNDMISYDPNTDPSDWTVNVMDYSNSGDLRTTFVKCGKTYTTLNFKNDNEYNQDGDSYSFCYKDYKAIFIINNSDDTFYHTPDDIVNKYNYNYCKQVTSVSCALLVQSNK